MTYIIKLKKGICLYYFKSLKYNLYELIKNVIFYFLNKNRKLILLQLKLN